MVKYVILQQTYNKRYPKQNFQEHLVKLEISRVNHILSFSPVLIRGIVNRQNMAVSRRGNYRLRFYLDMADWEFSSPNWRLLRQVKGPITRGRARRGGLQITEVGNNGLFQYTMYFGHRARQQQARNAADGAEVGVRLEDEFAEILEAAAEPARAPIPAYQVEEAGEAARARIPAYQVEEAGEAARARTPAYQVEEAGEAARARIPDYQVEAAGEAARARALDDQMDDDGQ